MWNALEGFVTTIAVRRWKQSISFADDNRIQRTNYYEPNELEPTVHVVISIETSEDTVATGKGKTPNQRHECGNTLHDRDEQLLDTL